MLSKLCILRISPLDYAKERTSILKNIRVVILTCIKGPS